MCHFYTKNFIPNVIVKINRASTIISLDIYHRENGKELAEIFTIFYVVFFLMSDD